MMRIDCHWFLIASAAASCVASTAASRARLSIAQRSSHAVRAIRNSRNRVNSAGTSAENDSTLRLLPVASGRNLGGERLVPVDDAVELLDHPGDLESTTGDSLRPELDPHARAPRPRQPVGLCEVVDDR